MALWESSNSIKGWNMKYYNPNFISILEENSQSNSNQDWASRSITAAEVVVIVWCSIGRLLHTLL